LGYVLSSSELDTVSDISSSTSIVEFFFEPPLTLKLPSLFYPGISFILKLLSLLTPGISDTLKLTPIYLEHALEPLLKETPYLFIL